MAGAEDKDRRFLTPVHYAEALNVCRFTCAGSNQLKTKSAPYSECLEIGVSSFSAWEKRYSDAEDVVCSVSRQ